MQKLKNNPIISATSIALLILVVCSILLIIFKSSIYKWKDPTAEIRNVVLALVALSSIPFVFLGYVNRSKDLMLKTESISSERLFDEISKLSDSIKSVGGWRVKTEFSQTKSSFGGGSYEDYYLSLREYWGKSLSEELKTPQEFSVHVFENMEKRLEYERIASSLCGVLAISQNYKNQELTNLVSINITSNFDEETLQSIYLLLRMKNLLISGDIANSINVEVFWKELMLMKSRGLIGGHTIVSVRLMKDAFE